MQRVSADLDRYLRRSLRTLGLAPLGAALALLLTPGAMPPVIAAITAVVLVLTGIAHYLFSIHSGLVRLLIALALAVVAVGLVSLSAVGSFNFTVSAIVFLLVGAYLGCTLLVLTAPWYNLAWFVGAEGVSWWLMTRTQDLERLRNGTVYAVVIWVALAVLAVGMRLAVTQNLVAIRDAEQAHTIERRASLSEAERRRGARHLHDTVLATLTMLAHSGVGVPHEQLELQAATDARMLTRLRLGQDVSPDSSGDYNLQTAALSEDVELEQLALVWQSRGVQMTWRLVGTLHRDAAAATALAAIGECLENVRRHSGVHEADVSVTVDESVIRAIVSDAGSGFDPAAVPAARLGLRESVFGRVEDAGGTVRIFSAPGQGTTVVLELPVAATA